MKLQELAGTFSLVWSILVLTANFFWSCFWTGFKVKVEELKLLIALMGELRKKK